MKGYRNWYASIDLMTKTKISNWNQHIPSFLPLFNKDVLGSNDEQRIQIHKVEIGPNLKEASILNGRQRCK